MSNPMPKQAPDGFAIYENEQQGQSMTGWPTYLLYTMVALFVAYTTELPWWAYAFAGFGFAAALWTRDGLERARTRKQP